MVKPIPSNYILFAFAGSFFAGCYLTGRGFINIYILLPILLLAFLLLFTNRQKKTMLIIPILIMAILFGAFMYYQAAAKQSSLVRFAGKTATLEGVVASEPAATGYGYKLLLKNVYYLDKNKAYKCSEKLQLYIGKEENLKFGDKIRVSAEIEPIARLRNFGDFDFEKYYKSKGIYIKAYASSITKLALNRAGIISQALYSCNQKVKSIIFSAMPQTEAALLYGILTGSKAEIEEEVMQVFSLTGLAHILSVSGLHIGFLVLLLTYILKPLKLNKQLHGIIVFVVVLFYILLIGAPVPAVRALLMLAAMLGGAVWGKRYDLNTSASAAALLLLVYNPLIIHDPSFIISFACIYSIYFFHKPFNNCLSFLPSWLRSSLALSLAVWVGITPVLINYFNYVSLINIILNVLAVPITFLITLAGFVAVVVGFILPYLAIFIFAASYYLIKLLYYISERSLLLPWTGFAIPSLKWYIYAIYYSMALTLIEEFWKYKSLRFKRRYMAANIIMLFIAAIAYIMPGNTLRLNYVDVGQGDCSVIRTPDRKVIVVDGGGSGAWQKNSYDIGKKLTVPALQHLGIWKVDTVIVSHIHDDHLGGVLSILESYKVGQVILPASDRYGEGEFSSENLERLINLCKAKNIPIAFLQSSSSLTLGKVRLMVLAPEQPFLRSTDSDVNNNSLVFKLIYKDFDALFTGDIQQEAEQRILAKDIQCDVIKVAHHGSPYSTLEDFVEKADPEISIISVGKNNYGHPAKEVIERLKSSGSKVYRTDTAGAVMLSTDGKKLKINTVR